MSIEGGATATNPKTVTSAESHGAKGKARAPSGDAADALAGSGFLALLTALEPEMVAGGRGARTNDQFEAADSPLPGADPATLTAQNLPLDLAMLLAQAGQLAADKLNTPGAGRPTGGRAGAGLTTTAVADKPETLAASAITSAVTEKPGDFKPNVDALQAQSALSGSARAAKAAANVLQSGADVSLVEARALSRSTLMDVSARDSALSGALASSGIGESFLRPSERVTARSSVLPGAVGVEGLGGQQSGLAGRGVEAPAAMADPSMLSFESMVADTVSYWTTQGVQNAELKLDGWGGEPIEVSISLKGDEARIDFRTDQPEIRQLLEGAVAHLKDLLKSEGLVLSGVSVGSSGQDGAAAQEQRHRQEAARQGNSATTDRPPAPGLQRVIRSVGRALDIFV